MGSGPHPGEFLADAGVAEVSALVTFNLAPLETRRDMAMLGLIHRTMLGKGPVQFRKHFVGDATGALKDPRATISGAIVRRSFLGLAAGYNMLPAEVKTETEVKNIQRKLQDVLKERAAHGRAAGRNIFTPRHALQIHPLPE